MFGKPVVIIRVDGGGWDIYSEDKQGDWSFYSPAKEVGLTNAKALDPEKEGMGARGELYYHTNIEGHHKLTDVQKVPVSYVSTYGQVEVAYFVANGDMYVLVQ